MAKLPEREPGMKEYVKHAFMYHWNLLLFAGGAALAVASGQADALLPIIGGLEIAYLTALSGIPRFRTAIDAKIAAEKRAARTKPTDTVTGQQTLERLLEALPPTSLRRFGALRQRSTEMRDIASGVRGHTAPNTAADEVQTPALDRLLFLFLKLLVTQAALERFLRTTTEEDLSKKVEEVRGKLAAAHATNDERVVRSLTDSLGDAELRLSNYQKSVKDADFVAIELDRIETKVQALVEMGVSRQDPDSLSNQVTAAAESMRQTEETVNQLQHLTGLADHLQDPPAILESDMGKLLARGR